MNMFSPRHVGSALPGLAVMIILLANGCGGRSGGSNEDFLETVRLSDDQKRVTSAVGKGKKAYQGTPSQMALQFLNENVARLGLTTGLGDLRLLSEKARSFSAHAEFQQFRNELPVENGRIKVNFDKKGHVVQVVNSYTPPAGALDQTSISKERAADIGINEFLRTTPHNPSKDEQQGKQPDAKVSEKRVNRSDLQMKEGEPRVDDVYFSRNGRLHRAYRISITADRPFGSKQFIVDANSAEIVQTKNFVYNSVNGEGQVFIPNPVNSLNDPTLIVISTISASNPNPYFTVELPELEASTAPFTLRGPYVVLEHIELPPNTPPDATSANGFSFTRVAPGFEDVMIYYHVNRMQRYIQCLGFTDVMNRQLRADAHGVFGAENSQYVTTPATIGKGYVAFGEVGVQDAEDADVIAHEYGHAIQDNQAEGAYSGSGEPGAMSEGFGDYWAFTSYDKETTEHGHDRGCLMEWDASPNCRRRVDTGPTADNFNSAYTNWENGKIWSTTLYGIFDSLTQKTADTLILQGHFNISTAYPSFLEAADAIIAANEQVFIDHPDVVAFNKTKLCEVFIGRKIYNAKCS